METRTDAFGKYRDENGEEIYCPLKAGATGETVSGRKLENCVEASTAGRYAANIHVEDRFLS